VFGFQFWSPRLAQPPHITGFLLHLTTTRPPDNCLWVEAIFPN
jgi:hypothetical protein